MSRRVVMDRNAAVQLMGSPDFSQAFPDILPAPLLPATVQAAMGCCNGAVSRLWPEIVEFLRRLRQSPRLPDLLAYMSQRNRRTVTQVVVMVRLDLQTRVAFSLPPRVHSKGTR